jgi:Cu/Ag efflux pump CusA
MNLTDLQHQITQSAEATSTLFVYMPILVLLIPLLLLYFSLHSLRSAFKRLV